MKKKQGEKAKLTKFGMYKLFLAGLVGILLLHFIITLWWVPRRDAGSPVLGDRMEGIQELEDSWISETTTFGQERSNVYSFSIFWNSGPVVYFNVQVDEGVSRSDARSVATDIVAHFVELTDGVAEDYDIQVVISRVGDDVRELIEVNHEAVRDHAFEHIHNIVETTLAHAEQYPTFNNINRAYENINIVYTGVIRTVVGEEGLEAMRERLDAIVELTAEQEDQLAEELGVVIVPGASIDRSVPPSDISTFPNFGVWNHDRERIDWN